MLGNGYFPLISIKSNVIKKVSKLDLNTIFIIIIIRIKSNDRSIKDTRDTYGRIYALYSPATFI